MPTYETTVEQAVRLPRAQTWTVHVAPDPAPLSSSDTRDVSVFFESISVDPVGVDLASEASG